MSQSVQRAAAQEIVQAHRSARTVRTARHAVGEHRHVWQQSNAGMRHCVKCHMQQRKYAGLWL